MSRIYFIGIVVFCLFFPGCAGPAPKEGPGNLEAEPPAEVEEIETVEVEEIRAVVSVSTGSTLAIRKTPGTREKPADDVIDRVPEGRVFIVKNRHNDQVVEDGYIWWEVEDSVTGRSGWSASKFLRIMAEEN